MEFINIILFTISLFLLFLSAYGLLRSLTVISRFLKISQFITGFLILGIGTSLPELFVGITSALQKSSALSLGNVIGANIIDLTLVIGIPVLILRGIKSSSPTIKRDSRYMLILCILPVILMSIGKELSRVDGVILIAGFIFYLWRVIKQQGAFTKKFDNKIKRSLITVNFIVFFASLILLLKSSQYTIKYSVELANQFSLPPIFIGVFILSIGTTMPELITGASAAIRGFRDLAIGNMVGTVIANSTLILGITALIYPIKAEIFFFSTSAFFMILIAFLFLVFVSSGDEFDWREGLAMILLYVFFLIVELNLKGFFI